MNCAVEARKLVNYITSLDESFMTYQIEDEFTYDHIGALYTNIFLQAGLNYRTVVQPRVQRLLVHYSEFNTVEKFQYLIAKEGGLEDVINWRDSVKINRINNFIEFSVRQEIDTCDDLRRFLQYPSNKTGLLKLNGVGPKTLDYLLKLLNFDTVAVDRHIYSFVEMADLQIKGYNPTKKVVEYAADILNISRSTMDHSIWMYMSTKSQITTDVGNQLQLSF